MSSVYSAASSDPPAKRKRHLQTTEPLTAHERHSRMWAIRESYARGARPPKPQSKHELDILKERHQFVRSSDVDPSTLSWEDQLAAKYYDSLFKEFAIVNLKHYKSGAIALRWRTEDELLAGIGHLTCASLRCRFHAPSPARLSEVEASGGGGVVDPDSSAPLVETRLEETEMNFGYVEGGERKSALVKVVLCRECARRLRYGRERAREMREGKAVVPTTGGGGPDDEGATGRRRASREGERRRGSGRDGEHSRDRSRRDEGRRREDEDADEDDDDDDFAPVLPPDLEDRRRSDPRASSSRSRRRSASPPSRRSHR